MVTKEVKSFIDKWVVAFEDKEQESEFKAEMLKDLEMLIALPVIKTEEVKNLEELRKKYLIEFGEGNNHFEWFKPYLSPSSDMREDKWIDVEKQLPQYYSTNLIIDKKGNQYNAHRVSDGDGYYYVVSKTDYCIKSNIITHWQPLPSPPKIQK